MLNHQKNWMLLLVASVLATGCATGPEARNKEVANRVVTEILSGGNFELANELYAPDFVNHGQTRDIGLAEDQAAARGWKSAFPDMVMTAGQADRRGRPRDRALVRARDEHRHGERAARHRQGALTGRGITIWRIVDGRITEEWSAFDQLSIMQQLGLIPTGP